MLDSYLNDALTAWPWIEFLATWWLQASILLAIGLLIASAMRRPAYQSTVFRATLVAVMLCPILALAVSWSGVAVLTLDLRQRLEPTQSFTAELPTALAAATDLSANHDPGWNSRERLLPNSQRIESQVTQPPALPLDNPSLTTDSGFDSHVASSAVVPITTSAPARQERWMVSAWLAIGVWLLGASLFGIYLLGDLWRARWLIKQSATADESCVRCCHLLAAKFKTPKPDVLINPLLSSPCLIGQWRPVILLPEDTQPDHHQRVFLHELAHLKRGDWAWTILSRVACALLWFHPLAWWLHRSHLSIAEDICDDYVIQHDGNREGYLQQLIEIAQQSLPTAVPAALSMVGFRSKLGKRALRILDTTRTLSTHVSQRFLTVALIAAFASVSSVAMLEIGQSRAAVTENDQAQDEAPSQEGSAISDSSGDSRDEHGPHTYAGTVVNADGQPISGAKITAINGYHSVQRREEKILAQTVSDRDGRYTLTFLPENGDNKVRVTAQGYGEDFVDYEQLHALFAKGETKLDFHLVSEQPITGHVVDPEGKPVAGVKLQILRIILPTSSEAVAKWSSQSHPDLLKGRSFEMSHDPRVTETVYPTRVTHEYQPGTAQSIQTDRDGRFQIDGYGQDTLVHVRLSGPSIAVQEVQLVARTMPVIHAFGHWVHNDDFRHYGNNSTLVAGPTQRIDGRVVDAETLQPLVGVPVVITRLGKSVWADDSVASVTDQEGRFELTGAPLGGGHIVEVRPQDDQPYFTTHLELPRSDEPGSLSANFRLTKTHWISGQVTDQDGKPIVSKLNLHPFRDNTYVSKYPNFDPRIMGQTPDHGTLTNDKGEFRIKAIPGHSVLTAFVADYRVNPLYYPNRPDGLLEKVGGEQMPKVLNPFSADFFDAMLEVELNANETEFKQDLVVKKGIERTLKLIAPQDQSVDSVDILGMTWMHALQPKAKLDNGSIKIAGLGVNESRVVVVTSLDGQWGKHLNIDGKASSDIEAHLERCCVIRGRVVNSDAEPVKNVLVRVSVENTIAPDTWGRELKSPTTNEKGEFSVSLPPGGTYTLSAYSAVGPNFFVKFEPKAGDDYNLGDLTSGVERILKDASEYRVPPADKAKTSQMRTKATRTADEPAPVRTGSTTDVSGVVVDAQGKRIANANVALIAGKKSGQFFTGGSDVLAEGTTDAQGQFRLTTTSATNQTHGEARLIVRAKDTALQARSIELQDNHQHFDRIELTPQRLVQIKLVDLEGNPAKNIRLEVQCVMPSPQNDEECGTQYHRLAKATPAWIGPLTTDDQGLLTVPGVAGNQGVALLVEPSDKFAIQGIALNTGWKEERQTHDATYRDIVKNLKPGEVPTIPLAPARVFEGTVRLGKNGPPAANAKVEIWASQQEQFGSMMSIEGRTDAQGHYRLIPYPGVRYGIQAYPPENQAYQINQVEDLKWDNTKSTLVTDIELPECVLARGQIVDATTGQPVVDASVQYWPMETNPNGRENIITGWQGIKRTNAKGEFAIAVLPGEGWLIVQAIGTNYAIQTKHERELLSGKPGGRRTYAHAFEKLDVSLGKQPPPIRIALQRGHEVELEVVDADGSPVEDAQVFSRLMLGEDLVGWRGFRAPRTRHGRVTLQGINDDGDIPIYILDAKRQLGTTVLINRSMKSAKARLEPCGQASLTLCNEEGQRTSGLTRMLALIVTPGKSMEGNDRDPAILLADQDYLPNIDRINHGDERSDSNGLLKIPALIPGATYRYFDYDHAPHDFVAKSGETIQLGSLTR